MANSNRKKNLCFRLKLAKSPHRGWEQIYLIEKYPRGLLMGRAVLYGALGWGNRKPCFTFEGGCRRVLDTKTAGPTQGHKKRITRHSACAGIKENACGQLLAVSQSRGSGPGPHNSLLTHPLGIVANPNFNQRCRRGTIQGQTRAPREQVHALPLT